MNAAAIKERPILFSGPMVRAILDGRKTQTRRVINPQPYIDGMGNFCWKGWMYGQNSSGVPHAPAIASPIPDSRTKRVLNPYGKPGDRLWVRETFAILPPFAPGYEPTVVPREGYPNRPPATVIGRWRPSIHMPRWASRITLEVTGVRVERLQDISEADAEAEGVDRIKAKVPLHRDAFYFLWDSINATRGHGWETNPWVWVVEFRRITP